MIEIADGECFAILAPPKPEPTLHDGWIIVRPSDDLNFDWKAHGVFFSEEACSKTVEKMDWEGAVFIHAAWMSDRSPVEDDPVRYGVCETCVEKSVKLADEWRSKAEEALSLLRTANDRVEALQVEVERVRKAYTEMQPVVDAAVLWERHFSHQAADRLVVAVRTYQQSPKKSAAEAVANVAEMMGPVKNCTTCGALSRNALCKNGVWTECTNSNYGNWEPRHD